MIRPLAGLGGRAPDAPDWFRRSVETPHDPLEIVVDGARIEGRAWGPRGAPGVVLVHGNAAHLGWWSFLAPLLARDRRVVTFSCSGMGGSDWRDHYDVDVYVAEMWAMAEAAGVVGLPVAPVLIGHSVGGTTVMRAAGQDRPVAGAVIVDTVMLNPEQISQLPPRKPTRPYADQNAALERFRLSPSQPCENIYIVDYLARMSLAETADGQYDWRFDPRLWSNTDFGRYWELLRDVRRPLAVIRGEHSHMTADPMFDRMRKVAPPGTPFIEIPDSWHHVMADQPIALVSVLRTLIETWSR